MMPAKWNIQFYDDCLMKNLKANLNDLYNPEFSGKAVGKENLWSVGAELLLDHHFRTVPGYLAALPHVSRVAGSCGKAGSHADRMRNVAASIGPQRCLVISNHWDTLHNFGPLLHGNSAGSTPLQNCTLAGFIDYNVGHEIKRIAKSVAKYVPIPYVENYFSQMEMARRRPRNNLISFRGSLYEDGGKIFELRKFIFEIDPLKLPVRQFHCANATNFLHAGRKDERLNSKQKLAAAMATSLFCLVVPGDTRSTSRLFDAIAAGCIPLIVGSYSNAVSSPTQAFDDLPFYDRVDYDAMALRIDETLWRKDPTSSIVRTIAPLLDDTSLKTVASMQRSLLEEGSSVLYQSHRSMLRTFLHDAFRDS